MKTNKIMLIGFFGIALSSQGLMNGINFGQIGSALEKAAEVAKNVAGVVKVGLEISSIGVGLWGSDADKARFAKVSGYISLATALAEGDFDTAKSTALQIGGKTAIPTDGQGEVVDVMEGQSEDPVAGIANAVGDIKVLSPSARAMLNANKRVIRTDDLKIGQLSNLKDQVVFEAMVPALSNQQLLQLPNGQEIVLQTRQLELGLRSKMPYRGNWQNYTQVVIQHVEKLGANMVLNERGSIVLTKDELAQLKTIWCNITNNTFGIFHTVGNNIMLSQFIQFNQGTNAQKQGLK
jgi:hypothetical protein